MKSQCRIWGIVPIGNSKYTIGTFGGRSGFVVYPGYDPRRVAHRSGMDIRERLGIPTGAPVFGVAARVCKEKAQDMVGRAFLRSSAADDGAHLIIAGGGDGGSVARYVEALGRSRRYSQVHYIGKVSVVGDFYAAIDVAVNGRRDAEPFGVSIVEALAMGKPVLTYALGGPAETVEDGVTGWLIGEPAIDAYRRGFDRAMEAKERWPSMGEEGQRRVEFLRSDVQAKRLVELMSQC